jgi:hypothetical protein
MALATLHFINIEDGLVTVDLDYDDATLKVATITYQSVNAPSACALTVSRGDGSAVRNFTIAAGTPLTTVNVPQSGANSLTLVRPWPGAQPLVGVSYNFQYPA